MAKYLEPVADAILTIWKFLDDNNLDSVDLCTGYESNEEEQRENLLAFKFTRVISYPVKKAEDMIMGSGVASRREFDFVNNRKELKGLIINNIERTFASMDELARENKERKTK